MNTYYFIYKTTHINGKYYIGRHASKKINDNYLGSGLWVKSIKDKGNLSRTIIAYATNIDQLLLFEQYYINLHWDDPDCMNYSKSSIGFASGKYNPMFGKKGILSPSYNKRGKLHPNFGKKQSKETSLKKSKSLKGRTFIDLHGIEKSEIIKNNLRKPRSEEVKSKLRKPKPKTVCRIIDKKLMTIANFSNWEKHQNGYITKTKKEFKFIYNNEILIILNLKQYCFKNSLSYACMKDVYYGKQKSHKGYTKCLT